MPSIEPRGKNSWRLIVENGTWPDGTRRQEKKSIRVDDPELLKPKPTSKRKLDAYLQDEMHKFKMEVEMGLYIKPERMIFENFVNKVWKKNYAPDHLGPYTRRNYFCIIDSHLIPAFGSLQISSIKTLQIAEFMTHLKGPDGRKDGRDGKLSTNTVLNIYKALKSIFDAAQQFKMIAVNPIEGIMRPRADKAEKRTMKAKKMRFSLDEAQKVIAAIYTMTESWKLYFIGDLLGGFRRGEHLALEWPQVDKDGCGLHVQKQISLDEDGRKVEAELKTEESEAFVPMPKWYMDELMAFKKTWNLEKFRLGAKWKGGDKQYVFHGKYGEMYYPNTATLTWRKLLQKHNLPHIPLHGLRHTMAMLLREDGVDLKSIQERLRHTKLATTTDIYAAHGSEQMSRASADRLDTLNPKLKVRSQSVPNR